MLINSTMQERLSKETYAENLTCTYTENICWKICLIYFCVYPVILFIFTKTLMILKMFSLETIQIVNVQV